MTTPTGAAELPEALTVLTQYERNDGYRLDGSVPREWAQDAYTALRCLHADNELLRQHAAKQISDSTLLTGISFSNGGMDIGMEGGACQLLAESFFDQFIEAGAVNFLELRFESRTKMPGKAMTVTLQLAGAVTPGQKLAAANARIAELEAKVEALSAAQAGVPAEALPAPTHWVPFLVDRADGCRGSYAIARRHPKGYREVWNLRSHCWTSASDDVLTLEQALDLLSKIEIPTAPADKPTHALRPSPAPAQPGQEGERAVRWAMCVETEQPCSACPTAGTECSAARAAPQPAGDWDHGPQATTVAEAARDVGKWLNERPNRPIDLRHVAMLAHYAQAPQPATADAVDALPDEKTCVDYVLRYGGRCRDCADENGVCPGSGLPCGSARKAVTHVVQALRYGLQHGYLRAAQREVKP